MSKIEVDINAVIDQVASRIVDLVINKLEGFKELDEHVDQLNRQVFIDRDALNTLGERVDKLTGEVQKLDNRFDNLRVLAADSSVLNAMSIRLDRLGADIIELRGIKQDPASLVKRLEAVEENAVHLQQIIHNVRVAVITAATKVKQDL